MFRGIQKCKWKGGIGAAIYKTSCGHEFHDSSETGNPVTDWLRYCPYCGKKVSTPYTRAAEQLGAKPQ